MKQIHESKRLYQIVLFEGDKIEQPFHVHLYQIYDNSNNYEWRYALNDALSFDELLDMPVGASMYFQPNRDNPVTKGIFCRVK